MSTRSGKSAIGCGMICNSIGILVLASLTVYYGFVDEDSTCQEGDRGGINLSDWCKGAGLSAIVVTVWMWLMVGFTLLTDNGVFMMVLMCTSVADGLFWIIWWIWGVVLLATSENNDCVGQGKGIAVMCIINLVIGKARLVNIKVATSSN